MFAEMDKSISFSLKTRHLQINMFPIQKHKFVFIKSGRNWRKEESGSMSRDRVEGIKHNEGWWVGRYGPGLFAALMLLYVSMFSVFCNGLLQ